MKTTNKSARFKPVSLFVFFFALACKRIFFKTHIIESRCIIRLENILFAFVGVFVHLSASFSPEMIQAGAVNYVTY